MNTPSLRPVPATGAPQPLVSGAWDQQWERVPDLWRDGTYRLDAAPFNEVFVRNTNYLRSTKNYDFIPPEYALIRQETAWWLWTIWAEGTRKIDPAMLTWWGRAITTLADARAAFTDTPISDVSAADFDPTLIIREALREFHERNGKYPSPGNTRNVESAAHSIHAHVSVRCSTTPWWAHDTWDLRLDPRIPRRQHEPHLDRVLTLATIEPHWLRDGVRYWLSQALIHDMYTWTTAVTRTVSIGTRFGTYLAREGITTPTLAADLTAIRSLTDAFIAYLRSPEATTAAKPLSATSVSAVQSHVQKFYEFMHENKDSAADFTGNLAWADLTSDHARLFRPTFTRPRTGNKPTIRYYTPTEMGALLAHLPVLATPTTETITIEHAGTSHTYRGLGDPQAARIWEIQALTGRRASEILMIDRSPIQPLTIGGTPDSGEPDPDAYVARLTYQQTKVDGVEPSILVSQAVVNIIKEQQAWLTENQPEAANGKHLFIQPRGNYQGLRPRSYRSYADALKRLNKATNLTTEHGQALKYTETHRLRHTRATGLLNDGVPVHVVQRYLGHKSPEMSMRYAQTLDSTAQAAFLKHKQIGADGRDINLNPRDLVDLKQLDRRADRILPNGLCLLPPAQTCDKGNACLPCGSFATDVTYLTDHQKQRDSIAAHIETRREQFERRHGMPMPDTNAWLQNRLRELAGLDAIIARLQQADAATAPVKGAGASGKTTPLRILDKSGAQAAKQALTDRLGGGTLA